MAEDVKPTRKNLMAIEDRIELSERGHDTLEQKRDGLIMEFMDILDQAQDVREDLNANYDVAQRKLNMARAMEGDVAVRGAAAALKEHLRSRPSRKHHGVVVPQIESSKVRKSLDERGYGLLGSSARIDEAADAYEELLETIILAAEVETAMKKMLKEIETTKRRVNALEFKLLPDLYENQEYIEQKLEEQEREEIFRMKKIKAKKEEAEKAEREADHEGRYIGLGHTGHQRPEDLRQHRVGALRGVMIVQRCRIALRAFCGFLVHPRKHGRDVVTPRHRRLRL